MLLGGEQEKRKGKYKLKSNSKLDQGTLGMSDPSQVNLHQGHQGHQAIRTTRAIRATKNNKKLMKTMENYENL